MALNAFTILWEIERTFQGWTMKRGHDLREQGAASILDHAKSHLLHEHTLGEAPSRAPFASKESSVPDVEDLEAYFAAKQAAHDIRCVESRAYWREWWAKQGGKHHE